MRDDERIREDLLQSLYEFHQKSKSVKDTAVGIMDLRRAMKEQHGYSQEEVVSNLSYLIDKGWVRIVVEEKEFTTPRGTVVHPKNERYKISSQGIDYMQGPSRFQKEAAFGSIKIKNIKGVVNVGDNNIINSQYQDLDSELQILQRKLLTSRKISDEDKLNAEADINSIRSQLSKPAPEKNIVKTLWGGVEKIVTAAEFVDLAHKITTLLRPFF